jgi:DNA-binding transcriptional MerR regulator
MLKTIERLRKGKHMTEAQETLIQIGNLAKELGITTRTIRYYEEIGLMGASKRSSGGARNYNREDVLRIKFILKLKELGISLKEMLNLSDTFDTHNQNFDRITPQVLEILDLHIGKVDDKIARLNSLRDDIVNYRIRISELLQNQSAE